MSGDLDMAGTFSEYFDIQLADTEESKEKVYQIRYNVYCQEFGYESLDEFPDDMEHDEFDPLSLHCLIVHRSTGRPAGCARLIPGTLGGKEIVMPFEEQCQEYSRHAELQDVALTRDSVCEISRFAVDGAFRRRSGERATVIGQAEGLDISKAELRSFNLISVATALSSVALAELRGTVNYFAMMEAFLPRMLRRLGIHFTQVGEAREYHGLRAPYYARVENTRETIVPELKVLYETIYDTLGKSLKG